MKAADAKHICTKCELELPANLPEILCPRCALHEFDRVEEEPKLPRAFGNYDLLEEMPRRIGYLLDPKADVQPNHRYYRVVLQDGTTVTGLLLGYDTFNVRLLDGKEQLRSFVKSELKSHGFVDTPMPSYKNTLTPQELADVVSYLSSLRTQAQTPPQR